MQPSTRLVLLPAPTGGVGYLWCFRRFHRMITTTLAVLALAGGIGSGAIPSAPNWQTDYAQAMKAASAEGKPKQMGFVPSMGRAAPGGSTRG